jgi:hypothetical protein
LKYLRHFRHCSLPSEIGFRGVSQKGHTSSLARFLAPSKSSKVDLEPKPLARESDCRLLYSAKITTARIPIDIPAVVSGQIDAQTFDTYACMNGLWVYSRYNQTASNRLATDCMTNNAPYLEPSTAGSLVDLMFACLRITDYDTQGYFASSEK